MALSMKWIKLIKRGLLIAGLGLVLIGVIWCLVFNVILTPSTQQQFFIKTDPDLNVYGQQFDIDCTLFQPKPEYDVYTQRPAVVLVHGFMSSKLYFKGLAFELTKRGFVCLTITAKGHSASGGAFSPTWENETLSAVKYLRDYHEILRIDPNRIGLVGHSMGSFSVSVASILDQELGNFWVNATIGIGGPFLNITRGFGSGFSYFLGNPMVYPDIWYDPELAMEIVIMEGRSNVTRPYNYMNIIGSLDEAFSVSSAYEVVYGMSTPSFWAGYGVDNQSEIVPGQLYGQYNGSARKLVILQGVDHLFEGQTKITVVEAINWFENSMKLTTLGEYPDLLDESSITEEIRILGLFFGVIGAVVLFIPLTIYFGNWLKPEMEPPINAAKMKKRDRWRMILIYGIAFVGMSFLVAPIIAGLNLNVTMSTDFLASNLLALPILVLGLLMVPVLIVLMWYEKKKFHLELHDFGLTKKIKPYVMAATYGFLLWLALYAILNLTMSISIHNLYIWRIFGFLELFIYIFIGMLVFEILFRGMIQNKFYYNRKGTLLFFPAWKEIIKSSIVTGAIEGLGLGISLTGLLAAGGFDVFSSDMGGMIPQGMGISLSFLPPMFILIPLVFVVIEIMFAVLKSWLYRKSNNNILASTMFVALALAWIFSVIMPAITLYAPRLVFMT
ncbi:MAG TPA: alpha/beta fold hydrolase [Candidatus Deferrimicrobium sp.]|nr:alpha/beta fold hydrolase [Candidatus Deferrimicrobium sp.]